MTAGGGWEKVLQVWWARRARATGNVAALSALRRGARGAGAGGWGLGVTSASPVGEELALAHRKRAVGTARC